jgi:integrase/recombinase XerD
MTWEEAMEQFLDSMKLKGLAYHTRRWHKENLQAVLKALRTSEFATEPGMVTENMLRDVVLKMVDGGLSPTTINHRVRSLKQFYQYLMGEALVGSSPAARLDRKKQKSAIIETFTEEQLAALLMAPDKSRFVGFRDYTIMLLLLDTGVRLSELVGIKLVDLKLPDNEVIITEGKGGKARRVFVSPKTKEALKKYLRVRGTYWETHICLSAQKTDL